MTVLVTGAEGRLGCTMAATLGAAHRVVAWGRRELDLTRSAEVAGAVRTLGPDAIVNCAAWNAVDAAEDEPAAALDVNAFGVRALARAAREADAVLVHFSTDFVFDGSADRPYLETDAVNPQSVYATSKLLGEWFAQDARAYVLRVESLFGGGRPGVRAGSLDRMADAILEGREVRAFTDRTVSPSYAPDVAAVTAALLTVVPPPGVYHCVGSGRGSWFEVATELARRLERPARIAPVETADRPHKVRRPQFCALSNRKLAAAGIEMPAWTDALRRYAAARLASVRDQHAARHFRFGR